MFGIKSIRLVRLCLPNPSLQNAEGYYCYVYNKTLEEPASTKQFISRTGIQDAFSFDLDPNFAMIISRMNERRLPSLGSSTNYGTLLNFAFVSFFPYNLKELVSFVLQELRKAYICLATKET